MTPKEKAEDIVITKMYLQTDSKGNYPMGLSVAIKCGLVAVDEIIIVLNGFSWTPTLDYWIEVKKEIEKL